MVLLYCPANWPQLPPAGPGFQDEMVVYGYSFQALRFDFLLNLPRNLKIPNVARRDNVLYDNSRI